jgi:hypothetical protein
VVKLYSGIKIKTGKMPWQKRDLLELDDNQFMTVLINTLRSFKWGDKTMGDTLIERVVRTYLTRINNHPDAISQCRISSILALEEMGKVFIRNEEEWTACLKELGFISKE